MIHPTAIIDPSVRLGTSVSIGAFTIVGKDCLIGDDVVIHSHVVIGDDVSIGNEAEIFPGTIIGKEPKGAGALARKPIFRRFVKVGAKCSVGPNAVLYYDTEIGEQTLIGDGASIREQCRVGSKCIVSRYVTINYNSLIGDRTKIMDLTHITGNCNIGSDVFISLTVGMTNDNAVRSGHYEDAEIKGPTIHDFAVIGAGATLLPRTVIGKGAMVGAGSVVTKDVAPYTLSIGAPARFVRNLETGKP